MNELQAALKIVLANTFIMYFKAHSYHWNVEGPNFADYHQFFATLYEELHGAIDPIAEQIRASGQYAPYSVSDVLSAHTCQEDIAVIASYNQMFTSLIRANDQVVGALNRARMLADSQQLAGLSNFLAERLDIHAKHNWMLQSLNKPNGA